MSDASGDAPRNSADRNAANAPASEHGSSSSGLGGRNVRQTLKERLGSIGLAEYRDDGDKFSNLIGAMQKKPKTMSISIGRITTGFCEIFFFMRDKGEEIAARAGEKTGGPI